MAYVQKNNPIPVTGCGRRRVSGMKKLTDLSGDGKVTQKDVLIGKGVIGKDGSPLAKSKKRTLSASCKAAAKRKFDVYPSAYANMWASKQQGKGKC